LHARHEDRGVRLSVTAWLDQRGLQHVTAVQVDQSGNVWVANNWETINPIVGGDGLVEFIGAAAPVATPLIGCRNARIADRRRSGTGMGTLPSLRGWRGRGQPSSISRCLLM
jgi:hypothetical protein